MGNFLHTDVNSGLSYYEDTDEVSGITTIKSMQDVEPVLKRAKQKRDSGTSDKGIAGHMKEYCYLPAGIMLELYKKGINMMNPHPSDWSRFFKEIETNYPQLKTTEMKAWRPR